MRAVVQRVSGASVTINGRVVGSIDRGLLVLVGFTDRDDDATLQWVADKLVGLRIFPDDEGRMNRDVRAVDGCLLVVSQFTLYGDVRKGRRPSFVEAAAPQEAERQYDRFVDLLRERNVSVATGEFGAMMDVALVNQGPVTILLER